VISRAEVHRNSPFDALPEAIEMLKHPVASNFLGRFGTMYKHATFESRCPLGTPESTKPPKPRPGEATSSGGSSALAARLSTWWKRPDGSLMVPARLNPRQRRTVRMIGSPENVPSCPGTSGQLRSLTSFADPPSALAEVTRVCFPKLTQAVL